MPLELATSNMEKAIERSQKYINIITAYTPETFTGDYESTIIWYLLTHMMEVEQ